VKVGATTHVKFRVLSFRIKIQGLVLLVMSGNCFVEDIVLRVETIFRVKT
jgi:hypothetical protein